MNRDFFKRFTRRRYWHAQEGICPLCNQTLSKHYGSARLSFDHVWPKARVGTTGHGEGNFLLVHVHCNQAKNARVPNGCERIWLFVVNRRLGLREHETQHWDKP